MAGMVARPVYVCTSMVGGKACGANAAMSSLFDAPSGKRAHWHCSSCAHVSAPSSASTEAVAETRVVRSLLLYPLVLEAGVRKPMPVRSKMCRVYLQAPSDAFSFDHLVGSIALFSDDIRASTDQSQPSKLKDKPSHFVYDARDSVSIWMTASSFEGSICNH